MASFINVLTIIIYTKLQMCRKTFIMWNWVNYSITDYNFNSNIKFLIRTPATNFSILFMALFLHSQTHHLIISEILVQYKAFK